MSVLEAIDLVVRAVAIAVVGAAAAVAATHWAVRRGALPPFGAWPRTVRNLSDPVLRPIERRLVRRGANPQDAPLWMLGIAVVGGLLLISGTRWLVGLVLILAGLRSAPPIVWLRVALDWTIGILMLALIVRVVSSWLGGSPYSRLLRPVYLATDWLVNPIRRVLPTIGMIDLSPLVAYLALVLVRSLLFVALR